MAEALDRASKRLRADPHMTAAEHSAGMLGYGPDQMQVFVRVCRFSQKLLDDDPMTGGLLCEVGKD